MEKKTYKSASAMEMAVKTAARKSGQDVNKAMEAFYPGRLLERVFSEDKPSFVLKGGRGMLARTVDARYTRDTDFLFRGVDLDEALEELKRVASIELNDFIEFRFVSAERIAEDQEYRDGYRVVFKPVLGGTKEVNDVAIDLVVDQVALDFADVITPANRLDVSGLSVFDYHVYPVANAIADKVCATMQKYKGGRESSRVRDLVDLVVYVTTERIDGRELTNKILLESRLRKIGNFAGFKVPASWHDVYGRSFSKSAKSANIHSEYSTVEAAEKLVRQCVDPAIWG